MRKILKDVPVAVPRFSLRAGGAAASGAPAMGPGQPAQPAPAGQAQADAAPGTAEEAQLRQWREAAERQGYEAGHRAASEEVKQQAGHDLARLSALCDALHRAQQAQQRQAEEFAAEFAYAVTTRVLAAAAPGRDGVLGAVGAAMAQIGHARLAAVRVHPADVAWVRQLLAGLTGHAGEEIVRVHADPRVRHGGCLLDTSQGTLDARLETQLQALKDSLLAAYRPAAPAA